MVWISGINYTWGGDSLHININVEDSPHSIGEIIVAVEKALEKLDGCALSES